MNHTNLDESFETQVNATAIRKLRDGGNCGMEAFRELWRVCSGEKGVADIHPPSRRILEDKLLIEEDDVPKSVQELVKSCIDAQGGFSFDELKKREDNG